MARVLIIMAAAGFALALICFAGVGMVGGFALQGPHFWRWGHHHWQTGWGGDGWDGAATGPTTSRDFPWGGGDTLRIDAPADVQYTQGAVAKITVTGPASLVNRVRVQGDTIGFDGWSEDGGRLKIVMTAPGVTSFVAAGSQDLSIDGYRQPTLSIDLSGSGDVVARGEAANADLRIAGSGDADLRGLTGDATTVRISGSGDATVAPKTAADIHITGSGDVTLLTNPAHVTSEISGSGDVIRSGGGAEKEESDED